MSTMLPPRCPNPECPPGTVRSRPLPVLVRHGHQGLRAHLHSHLTWLALWLVLGLTLGMGLTYAFVGLRRGQGSALLPLLVVLAAGYGLFLLRGSLDLFTMRQQRCRRCGFCWGVVVYDANTERQQLRMFEGELAQARAAGDQVKTGTMASTLGTLKLTYQSNCGEALALCREGLELLRQTDNREAIAYALNNLGFTAFYCDETVDPRPLLEESVASFRELKNWSGLASSLNSLGFALLAAGEVAQAAPLLAEGLALAAKLGRPDSSVWGLEGLAMAAGASGDAGRAAQLFGAADALRAAHKVPLPEQARALLERAVKEARQHGSPEEWLKRWVAGRAMALPQAVEYALEPAHEGS